MYVCLCESVHGYQRHWITLQVGLEVVNHLTGVLDTKVRSVQEQCPLKSAFWPLQCCRFVFKYERVEGVGKKPSNLVDYN